MGRTLKELAQEALDVQDACNLSGVIHGWSRSITDLRAIVEKETGASFSTDTLNRHPVNVLWADKVASLAGVTTASVRTFDAYYKCREWVTK